MIGVIFQFGSEMVNVEIVGTELRFKTSDYNSQSVPIEALQLNREGVIKEFPDLRYAEDWKQKAIERLKMKIKDMSNEMERINFVITDLKSFGYVPMYYQKQGHRVTKFNGRQLVQ